MYNDTKTTSVHVHVATGDKNYHFRLSISFVPVFMHLINIQEFNTGTNTYVHIRSPILFKTS